VFACNPGAFPQCRKPFWYPFIISRDDGSDSVPMGDAILSVPMIRAAEGLLKLFMPEGFVSELLAELAPDVEQVRSYEDAWICCPSNLVYTPENPYFIARWGPPTSSPSTGRSTRRSAGGGRRTGAGRSGSAAFAAEAAGVQTRGRLPSRLGGEAFDAAPVRDALVERLPRRATTSGSVLISPKPPSWPPSSPPASTPLASTPAPRIWPPRWA
jgi:hypothetical protein